MPEAKFATYTNCNTLYDAGDTIKDVILSYQESFKNIFKWFSNNEKQGNSRKCHLVLSNRPRTINNTKIDKVYFRRRAVLRLARTFSSSTAQLDV